MKLILGSHKLSCTHLFNYKYRLSPNIIHQFLGSLEFERFPIKKQKGPNLILLSSMSRSTQSHRLDKSGST